MRHLGRLTLPKALLIMPLVMHDTTVIFLANGNTRTREVAPLVSARPDLFANFPTRFDESLSITFNAIQLLIETGFIKLDDGLILVKPLKVDTSFGNRAKKIEKASENIAALLSSPVEELYLNFRVKL
tara:strand:- start:530472 stop:530855 length:384 start_codon:yes stop_codon:yes gene_type:complete